MDIKNAANAIKDTITKAAKGKDKAWSVPVPKKEITESQTGSDQRSNGWVVCFVTYDNPAPNYERNNNTSLKIIVNDAVSVSVSNTKSSFGKTAQITLKSTEDFYPSIVSNGDWCFIWMTDNETDRQRIENLLGQIESGGTANNELIRYDSGLKFAGRIISCSSSDSTQATGQRTITQSVSAQSFLEFASTVYYTGTIVKLEPVIPVNGVGVLTAEANAQRIQDAVVQTQIAQSLEGYTKKLADAFKVMLEKDPSYHSPDRIICMYYLLSMGIGEPQEMLPGVPTTFNSGISIPSKVAKIFNKPNASKLWQLVDIHAGIQKFKPDERAWYKGFVPNLRKGLSQNMKDTGVPTKGYVPFKFELWSNMSLWSIFSKHLNPVVNEMFTSLRLNKDGNLNLTLTVREKPLSTGLFNSIAANEKYYTGKAGAPSTNTKTVKRPDDGSVPPEQKVQGLSPSKKDPIFRTLFGEVPRWVINESIVRSYSASTNENARVNFVMVWGRSGQAEMLNPAINLDSFMSQQFANGNYYLNPGDIARNGLRSSIMESHYDTYFSDRSAPSYAKLWARQNADWAFNSHLKLNATLTLNGVQDPIVEGDNLEYRGILYHIESVTHNASISAAGPKTWTTTLSLSNGMLASSFDDLNSPPLYAYHQSSNRAELVYPFAPGVTSVKTGE
jgi:hypothetical protein